VNQVVNPTAGEQANQAPGRAAGQASNFPPPPNVPSTSVNAPQGAGPAPNQTTAFNGPTGQLRGGAVEADSGRHQAMSNEDNSGTLPVRAKLIIQRGGKIGKEFPIVSAESMIGRWDADGGIFPDIDLDQDDPEAKVSRRHARIQFLNNQYLIEDLGSTNGTFINRGPRLLPGTKQPLNNGDEIIVGKTFLKFVLS
jgi:pSer/pThr/pTyr-binding forkhead associated (FHA) protein